MYDADGLRSAKGVNGVKTTYQYVGDKLFYEKRGNNTELYYFYDSYGKLSAISYVTNGTATPFYVSTNSQGDVLSIHTGSGVKVAQYDYDTWGNATVMVVTTDADGKYIYTTVTDESAPGHISTLNPIRYRGYYYDEDLELYYLQSRYYDATIGRFINADGYISTGQDVLSYNMFAYCMNNPVNMSDPSGAFGVFFSLLNKIVNKALSINNTEKPDFWSRFFDAVVSSDNSGNTFSTGFTAGTSYDGYSVSGSCVLSVDTSYNYEVQKVISDGVSTGVGCSGGIVLSYTNANNVEKLRGNSESVGFTLASVPGISINLTTFSDNANPNKNYFGVDVILCAGASVEVHDYYNYTTPIISWNPINSIKGWLNNE